MKRISTDAEYLNSGKVIVDADGIPVQIAPTLSSHGQGSPEGKISAPVGTVYTDTDATSGAIRWIKTSGTGNTGWRVEYGNTGWRDISQLMDRGFQGKIHIRRTAHDVKIRFIRAGRPEDGSRTLQFTLPAGWIPDPQNGSPLLDADGFPSGGIRITYTGAATIKFENELLLDCTASIPTQGAWPSSLPGTPA